VVCLAAVLAQPFAPLVLSGAATPDQVFYGELIDYKISMITD